MTFNKAFIYTTLLLTSNFTLAAQLFEPMAEHRKQASNLHVANQGLFEKHQAQGTFPIDIPDGDPVGIDIPIDLTGTFNSNIITLAIQIDTEHTFINDLEMTLTAPNGLAQLVLFSRVGLSSFTGDANLDGLYTFADVDSNIGLTNDFWATASLLGNSDTVPPAVYRTSTEGKNNNNFGGCTTRMDGAFNGLTPAQSNGIWTLHVADHVAQDTGSINSINMLFVEDLDSIFKSAFEAITSAPYVPLPASDILGTCQKAQYDFTGTGFSDYVTSWEDGDSQLVIQMVTNDGTDSPTEDNTTTTGLPFADTEMTSGGDFDGDGIKDLVFKTPLNDEAFQYLIRRSSRPDDLPVSVGIANPPTDATLDLQIGDYDGDGLDDFAFYASNAVTTQLTGLSIVQSSSFTLRQIPTTDGTTSDFRPSGGFDHNGDQIADLALFIDDGSGQQIVQVYDGLNGSPLFDSVTAVFVEGVHNLPGTFLANNLAGIGIYVDNDPYVFQSWNDTNSSLSLDLEISVNNFGNNGDVVLTGDYDGDGIDDFGVWRPNTDGLGNRFIIRPSDSIDPDNNLIEVSPGFALSNDAPLANIRAR